MTVWLVTFNKLFGNQRPNHKTFASLIHYLSSLLILSPGL